MKNLNLIITLVALWFLPQLGKAQQFTGTSGLAHIPTGEMHHEGDALIGGHFLNKAIMPDTGFLYQGEKYHTFNYYVALAPFSWIEMSYVCTERIYRKDAQGNIVNWSKDRYASVKIRPLKEGKYYPAVALGCNDVWTSFALFADKPNVQFYFQNWYIAATKHFEFSGNEL